MKKMMVVGAAALAAMAIEVRAMSLLEASRQIDAAVSSDQTMASVVGQLSPSDQVAFLARVNAAIGSLPGAPAEKAAKYLSANKAAVKAAKGNRTALLAEVFATVPPEALTVINERFASELFDRNANPAQPISDGRMVDIATNSMASVKARTATADNPAIRNAFAALLFIRASDGSPESLRDTLADMVSDSQNERDLARGEWFPAALGEGQPKSYEPMLGASGTEAEQPDFDTVARLSSAEAPLALLADLGGKPGDISTVKATLGPGFASLPEGIGDDSGLDRIPRSIDPSDAWYGGYRRSETDSSSGSGGGYRPTPTPTNCRWIDSRTGRPCVPGEPGGYCLQICD